MKWLTQYIMDGLDENALQREDGPSSAALEMFKYQFNLN